MLLLKSSLVNKPILSLRTNGVIATSTAAIINPNNLKIEGVYVIARQKKESLIVLYQDIRSLTSQGIVVNDHDALSQPEILVRLQEILKLHFVLEGKPVITAQKSRVGRVRDYAFDSETFYIQKIYVGQSLLKNFTSGQLSVDRNQIIEITDKHVVISDLLKKAPLGATNPASSQVSSAG
ncbi:MAG TPA: hypothetical protein VMR34_00175 [Candidatus Saccharimonadales bacterium]|nr:hypothetical protein [Candidatus Saccharimonadales bacterium]